MNRFARTMAYFMVGMTIMGGSYYYLDQVFFAPTADFTTLGDKEPPKDLKKAFDYVNVTSGKRYYSHDGAYMAVVEEKSAKIYKANDKNSEIKVDLRDKEISFFEWMPDRNLAILALHAGTTVTLEQFNPENPEHKTDTDIEKLPRGSKIVDMAYSTATNVIYMKVEVGPNQYRVYRTDANYDTRRIYVQAENIGRLAVFYDEDKFFYDNLRTGDVYMYNDATGGWRAINPAGAYRLIGVDKEKNIYVAAVDKEGKATSVSRGKLGVGFAQLYTYATPVEVGSITVANALEEYAKKTAEKPADKGATNTKKQ